MSIKRVRTATALTIVLLIASITLSIQAQAQLSRIGTSPTNVEGYPNLGPLPAGVTPAYSLDTLAFMSTRPNPIGVGQALLVNVWVSPGTYHAFYMANYQVDIKKPDGSTETVGPFNSYTGDSTAWFEYVPDQPGTWQFKFTFPGTYIPAQIYWDLPGSQTGGYMANSKYYKLYTSMWYKPAETEWQNLTVLPDMVSSWPYMPLPSDYWSRPVNVMWRDWGPSLGSYPFTGSVYYYPNGRTLYASNYKYTGYVTAPNSAHVVWKRLGATNLAGMVGGYTWDYSLSSGSGTPDIIFQGRCYDSVTKYFENGTSANVYQCYDLRTGEVYWERSTVNYITPQYIEYYYPQAGIGGAGGSPGHEADVGWQINFITISSSGGGRLYRTSPSTGANSGNYSISPLTSATYYMPGYALSVQDLGSSAASKPGGRYRLINWTTYGSSANLTLYNTTSGAITSTRIAPRTYDNLGYQGLWNISWPRSSLGVVDYDAGVAVSGTWSTPPGGQWCIGVILNSTDLYTGQTLWSYQTNDTVTENAQSPSSFVCDRGKVAFGAHGRHWTCWDARTGTRLWTSEQTDYPWGAWWPYNTASYDITEDLGAIITSTYEGVYAINWDNGEILWHYTDENAVPFEGPYDATPFFTGVMSADGKIFAFNGEHTTSYPRDRGWSMYCINGTTGELVWKIKNPMTPGAVADGYLTASNPYDGYMYVFGKGKSATTVTAPDVAVSLGTAFTIKGTVLDQSPAQAGTPCVSKDSMTTQMEYLHLQMPIGGLWGNETITGVPVVLTAIGSDGTVFDLGTTTTNGYGGTFGMAWTPTKQDTYTIMASFNGDESYGSSMATTTMTVGPAPTTPETPTQPEIVIPDYTMAIVGVGIAVILAVAIVGALILRKR